jgi:hypothetical protein
VNAEDRIGPTLITRRNSMAAKKKAAGKPAKKKVPAKKKAPKRKKPAAVDR